MTIPKVQAGEIGRRFRQPLFCVSLPRWTFLGAQGKPLVRIALAFGALLLFASAASAEPARLLTARFSGDCDVFTIEVTGDGLHQPNPTVSYNIKLTPRSGEPLFIVDSFVVTPDKDGKFHKTVHGTWEKFEYTLTDSFTLSGSAILISDLRLLHTISITVPRAKLNCRRRP